MKQNFNTLEIPDFILEDEESQVSESPEIIELITQPSNRVAGLWNYQQKRQKNGKFLNQIIFISLLERFEEMLSKLKEFKEKNGNCMVSHTNGRLGGIFSDIFSQDKKKRLGKKDKRCKKTRETFSR